MKDYITVSANYRKAQIPIDDIAYITVDGRKTQITRRSGGVIKTNQSMKSILAMLPEDQFSNINRGIVISTQFVKSEENGVYTMQDGAEFTRRVRSDRLPKKEETDVSPAQELIHVECPGDVLKKWLDPLPQPILIMEMVYGQNRGGVDFLVRYCSKAMATLEHQRVASIVGQSIQNMQTLGSAKWMSIFADVAINGSTRTVEDILEDSNRFLRLQCYQPQPGFCACIITDLTRENKLVQELFRRKAPRKK